MGKSLVSIVRYEKPLESIRKAVDLSKGLDHLPAKARVFIKPNIVFFPEMGNHHDLSSGRGYGDFAEGTRH
jgi:uncharacterized protein (DUF362 family)